MIVMGIFAEREKTENPFIQMEKMNFCGIGRVFR